MTPEEITRSIEEGIDERCNVLAEELRFGGMNEEDVKAEVDDLRRELEEEMLS
jgi:hypothetical protein